VTLDEIEKLIATATPGPWIYNGTGGYVAFFSVTNGEIGNYISAPNSGGLNPSAPDAAFIAASRELMPRMVKALRTLEWIAEHSIIECGRWTEAVMKSREALADLEQP